MHTDKYWKLDTGKRRTSPGYFSVRNLKVLPYPFVVNFVYVFPCQQVRKNILRDNDSFEYLG